MDDLQKQVGLWGLATFPEATRESIFAHLREEVDELVTAPGGGATAEEAADCLLLLLHIAHRGGFSLYGEALRKFKVIETSEYRMDPVKGYRKRVKD